MTWIRSSACSMGTCVEVRHVDGHVEVRDNTTPDTVLHITPADWAAFLVGAKAGEFDGPAADIPHPNCWSSEGYDHADCLRPSGKACVECGEPAGTLWGPYFCPPCDVARLRRINSGLADILAAFPDTTPDES